MPWWAAQQLAEERRRALTSEARVSRLRAQSRIDRRAASWAVALPILQQAGQMAAADATRRRTLERRALGYHVGSWLIRAGARIGGASMRAS